MLMASRVAVAQPSRCPVAVLGLATLAFGLWQNLLHCTRMSLKPPEPGPRCNGSSSAMDGVWPNTLLLNGMS